jgi:deoxyguanosine kinase
MTRIISIEGNIGSGKSTLVKKLKSALPEDTYYFVDEPVDIWQSIQDTSGVNIINKFYSDQAKYAFSFQMMAYISRVSMLKQAIRENPGKIIVTERCVDTDREVFAKMLYDDGLIEEINYSIYTRWFDEFSNEISICGMVYVKTSPEVCSARVIERARDGETIPLSYLRKCHDYHEMWLSTMGKETTIFTLDGNIDTQQTPSVHDTWVEYIGRFTMALVEV